MIWSDLEWLSKCLTTLSIARDLSATVELLATEHIYTK